MTCEHARSLLLEADPAALRAVRGTPLGAHLAQCEDCARAAREIAAATAALHAALGTLSAAPAPRRAARRRAWPRLAVLVPLAAAALLLLVLRRDPLPPPLAPSAPEVPRQTVVNSTGGSGVAVMQTRNPDITVVWNF